MILSSNLTTSELVSEISSFNSITNDAKLESFSRSTALMIETTSAKESGLPFTASNTASKSALVAEISSDKAIDNASSPLILASASTEIAVLTVVDKVPTSASAYPLTASAEGICTPFAAFQSTVVKKSLICFERICAIII